MIEFIIVRSHKKYIEEFGNNDNELIIHKGMKLEVVVDFILNGSHYDKRIITIPQYKSLYYKAMDILQLYYEK